MHMRTLLPYPFPILVDPVDPADQLDQSGCSRQMVEGKPLVGASFLRIWTRFVQKDARAERKLIAEA